MNLLKEKNRKKTMRRRRSRAKVFGTAAQPRLTVFRSNRYVYAQLINDEQGRTLAASRSANPTEAGEKLGQQAAKAGIKKAVFQKGPYKFHGRVKTLAEAAKKSGLSI